MGKGNGAKRPGCWGAKLPGSNLEAKRPGAKGLGVNCLAAKRLFTLSCTYSNFQIHPLKVVTKIYETNDNSFAHQYVQKTYH